MCVSEEGFSTNALLGYQFYDPIQGNRLVEQDFQYPQFVKDRQTFRCPLAPERTDTSMVMPAVHPVTGQPIGHPFWHVPIAFHIWDSYDGTRVPHPNGPYQLHYVRKWTPGKASFMDNPRQLIYREPPDSTVVTWCTYHRVYRSGQPEQGSIDLVLFLDGHVRPTPSDQMLPMGGDPMRPYKVKPTP
jgi:hypothetical protein